MNISAQENYLRTQVNTASPSDLTLMLYNGCIKFMKQAFGHLHDNNMEQKNACILKARDIIMELDVTLDMKYDISQSLHALYTFINEQLAKANMSNDEQALNNAIELVTELRSTWHEAMKLAKTQEQQVL